MEDPPEDVLPRDEDAADGQADVQRHQQHRSERIEECAVGVDRRREQGGTVLQETAAQVCAGHDHRQDSQDGQQPPQRAFLAQVQDGRQDDEQQG